MTLAPSRITLTTDYGLRDGYVGALKGAVLAIAPDAHLIDITHELPPQDVLAGAVTILTAAATFPANTIHLVVVDPEVGTDRLGIVVRAWDQWFVAPDSGVLHFILELPEASVYEITRPFADPQQTTTFAGRDWFAPTAADLAKGSSINLLGTPLDTPAKLHIPIPEFHDHRWVGHVIHTDHFGNIISNLPCPDPQLHNQARVFVADQAIGPVRRGYADVALEKPVATIGSLNTVEVGINQGNAQKHFEVRRGDTFEILFPEKTEAPPYPAWCRRRHSKSTNA